MSKYLSKRSIALASLLLLGVIFASIYYLGSSRQNASQPGVFATPAIKSTLSMSKEDKIKAITATHNEVSSIDQAQRRVSFKILIPQNMLGGKLERVFVERIENQKDRGVRLVYSNGIFISETPCDPAPDYDNVIAERVNAVKEGLLKEVVFKKVKVQGHDGMGAEPGVNELPGGSFPRPSSLDWYDGGVKILIMGGEISLKDLQVVAESMYL